MNLNLKLFIRNILLILAIKDCINIILIKKEPGIHPGNNQLTGFQ